MTITDFWVEIDAQLDQIETTKPETAEGVIVILEGSGNTVFFVGSGGDRQLLSSMFEAGWRVVEANADYYWGMEHLETKATLGYVEGDIFGNVDPNLFFTV